jgi:hypothetical protein
MALPAVTKKSNYVKGGGVLRIAERDATGALAYFDPGNAPSIELERTVETSEHQEARSGSFNTDKVFTVSETNTITVTLESMTLENFALFMGADVEEQTISSATVTDEELRGARRGGSWDLGVASGTPEGVRKITSFTSLEIKGTARANSAAVAIGDVLTSGGVAYVVTEAGTTDAAPPTFPTNGATVADGMATIKHLGPVVLTVDDDYVVSLDPASVELVGSSTADVNLAIARMPSGYKLTLLATYVRAADTYQRLIPPAAEKEYKVRFDGQAAQGTPLSFVANYCTIVGNGASQWVNAEEPQNFQLTITALKRDADVMAIQPIGATTEIPWS